MSNLPPTPDWSSLSKEEASHAATDRLDLLMVQLKAVQKALRRDWPNLTPGQRSASSREVKQLEEQQHALEEILKMNRFE